MDTPSWNTEIRGSLVASSESEAMPRITKPGLLGDWFCTSKPGTKRDSSSNSCRPLSARNSPETAVSAAGTSWIACSRFCRVTITSSVAATSS